MEIRDLGLQAYEKTHALQKELVARVQNDPSLGYLLLVEHPPVYTMGRFGSDANVLADVGFPTTLPRVMRPGSIFCASFSDGH